MLKVNHIFNQEASNLQTPFTTNETASPLIISIPHSGLYILEQFSDRFKYGPGFWVDVEFYTDEVYPASLGSSLIAHLAPQQVNFNRSWEQWEKTHERDPIDMQSLLKDDVILLRPYEPDERAFLKNIWDSYHQALWRLIQTTKERHGYALLIDCHSLNSRALANVPDAGSLKPRADFVIGSLDDTSAHPSLIKIFEDALNSATADQSLTVVRNDPYKGGYITKEHHDPANHVHVLQLEIKKDLYMYEGLDFEAESFKRKDTLPAIAKILQTAFTEFLERAILLKNDL